MRFFQTEEHETLKLMDGGVDGAVGEAGLDGITGL